MLYSHYQNTYNRQNIFNLFFFEVAQHPSTCSTEDLSVQRCLYNLFEFPRTDFLSGPANFLVVYCLWIELVKQFIEKY